MRESSTITLLLLTALALSCAIPGWAGEKPAHKPGGRTEIGGTPWKPQSDQSGKVVYGTDDRRDVFEETDANRRALADSTCALVDASNLTEAEDGTYTPRPTTMIITDLNPAKVNPSPASPWRRIAPPLWWGRIWSPRPGIASANPTWPMRDSFSDSA